MADDTFERLRKCIAETLDVNPERVTLEAEFGDDLDADSLDLVELVMALEEEFGVDIPEEELGEVKTVGKALALVTANLAEAS